MSRLCCPVNLSERAFEGERMAVVGMCRRVVGPVVAAALMVGAVGVTAAPAQASQASGPADYAAQAGRAADYIDSHLSLIHISEPTRHTNASRMPSSA